MRYWRHFVAEHGYYHVTMAQIAATDSVSRRDFYAQFANKEECLLAAFDVVVDHLRRLIAEALEPLPDWPNQVVEATRAGLEFFASEPDLARLCFTEALSAGPLTAVRYREHVQRFAHLLEPGRAERGSDRELPANTAATILGAICRMVARSLSSADAPRLPALRPDILEFILVPFPGDEQAARIAAEP